MHQGQRALLQHQRLQLTPVAEAEEYLPAEPLVQKTVKQASGVISSPITGLFPLPAFIRKNSGEPGVENS